MNADEAARPDKLIACDAEPGRAGRAARLARAEGRTLTVDGNRLTLFVEADRRLEALIDLIDGARKSLRLLYYIFLDDPCGRSVKQAILRAVDRGVSVSLLVDGFGSADPSDEYFGELQDAGVRFCRFHATWSRRYLIRNHQKLALADDQKVLIGGFNVDESYFKSVEEQGWRDLGLLVEGPAAKRLTGYYDELIDWAQRKKSKIRDLLKIITTYSEDEGPLQWAFGGPTRHLSPWARTTCRDLEACQDVEFIAAYFAPTRSLLGRIEEVVERGGRARIITAAKSDNNATIAAARWTYARLLRKGVEIYEYQPTKLHAKLVIFDDVVHIGSSNFDIRSLYLNAEMMLRVEDEEFASLMRIHFEEELGECVEITPSRYRKMASWWNRLKWALSFFLVTSADYSVTRRLNFGLV